MLLLVVLCIVIAMCVGYYIGYHHGLEQHIQPEASEGLEALKRVVES